MSSGIKTEEFVSVFTIGYKVHFCSRKFSKILLDELCKRRRAEYLEFGNESVGIIETRTSCIIDTPGPIMIDRPLKKITIDTFELLIPFQDFSFYTYKLLNAPRRFFTDGSEYYKIHGGYVCVVLTPEQRNIALIKMKNALHDIEKRGYELDAEFNRRIREVRNDKQLIAFYKNNLVVQKDNN